MAVGLVAVEVVDEQVLVLHDEVVGDQDAVERTDRGAQRVQRVVDHLGRVEQVPGHDEHRAHRRDHAAAEEGDVLGRDVGEVERG